MPRLRGLLDYFSGLENIPIERISAHLSRRLDPRILENQLANLILYPQVIPVQSEDVELDLAILREALKINRGLYFNPNLKRIIIPQDLSDRFPNLQNLAWVFVDAFLPPAVTTIALKKENIGLKKIGSSIRPEVVKGDGWIFLEVDNKKYQVKPGSLVSIPAPGNQVTVKFESKVATLGGRSKTVATASGGNLGLLIDARKSAPKEED